MSSSSSDLISAERQVMVEELAWLMKWEYPRVLSDVGQRVKDCSKFIQKSAKAKDALDEVSMETINEEDPVFLLADSRTVTFETPDQALKGMVLLEGCSIAEAEVSIKFPKWHKGHLIKTHIRSTNPWSLTQVRDALGLTRQVTELIARWTDLKDSAPDSAQLIREFNELLGLLVQAKEQMLMPLATSFQKGFQSNQIFNPPLPTDILVDFKIKNKELVITAAVLKPIGKPQTTNTPNKTFFSRKQNQYFEILDKATVDLPVQKFETVSQLIQDAIEVAEEFLSKLTDLSSAS